MWWTRHHLRRRGEGQTIHVEAAALKRPDGCDRSDRAQVLGTKAEDQLDAPSAAQTLALKIPVVGGPLAAFFGLVAALWFRLRHIWLPAAAQTARGTLNVTWLFLTSLVPRVPSRRPRAPPPAADG